MTPALVARMSWHARQQLARRRERELRAAALEHYARFGDGPSAYLFREPPFESDEPPTNITAPPLRVDLMLLDEEKRNRRVASAFAATAECGCHTCTHRTAYKREWRKRRSA